MRPPARAPRLWAWVLPPVRPGAPHRPQPRAPRPGLCVAPRLGAGGPRSDSGCGRLKSKGGAQGLGRHLGAGERGRRRGSTRLRWGSGGGRHLHPGCLSLESGMAPELGVRGAPGVAVSPLNLGVALVAGMGVLRSGSRGLASGLGGGGRLGSEWGSRLGSGVAPRVGDGRPRLGSEGGRPSGFGLPLPRVGARPGSLYRARTWGSRQWPGWGMLRTGSGESRPGWGWGGAAVWTRSGGSHLGSEMIACDWGRELCLGSKGHCGDGGRPFGVLCLQSGGCS